LHYCPFDWSPFPPAWWQDNGHQLFYKQSGRGPISVSTAHAVGTSAKTANSARIDIPATVLARADEVIE
jgi:hypothetical protein